MPPRQLRDALGALRTGAELLPRDAALGAFRRHLARIQRTVREAFEAGDLPG